jgi:hypothetical protein
LPEPVAATAADNSDRNDDEEDDRTVSNPFVIL